MKEFIEDIFNWQKSQGRNSGWNSDGELGINLIKEELSELIEANNANNKEGQIDAIVDLFWVILDYANEKGISANEILTKINKVRISNWSKFCSSEEDAQNTVAMYKLGTHPDKKGVKIDAIYKGPINGKWIVLRKEDGKTLKSYKYIPVEKL